MFQPGQLLVYGSTGVCRVEGVAAPGLDPTNRKRQYYQLKPLSQDGVIYAPMDSEKVPIRAVISREEAEALIDQIPSIHAEACHAPTVQALAQRYQSAMGARSCRELLELVMSIYVKQRQMQAQKRRLGQVDERCMKQAERLLYSELSAALGIPAEEVQPYIASRVHSAQNDNMN